MRAIFGLIFLVTAASASVMDPIYLGSFSVTGGGSFGCDFPDASSGYSFHFTGSNANYSISVSSNALGGSPFFDQHLAFPCSGAVGQNVTIADLLMPDFQITQPLDISVSPEPTSDFSFGNPGQFELGNGPGFLTIYDVASAQPGNPGTVIATATLSGNVTIDSIQSFPQLGVSNGTFTITPGDSTGGAPEPEPATALLLPGAAGVVYSVRRRIRSR